MAAWRRLSRGRKARLLVVALAAAALATVGVVIAIAGGRDRTPAPNGEGDIPALGLPHSDWPDEEEGDEATLTPEQAAMVGDRRAPANRVSTVMRGSAHTGRARPISGPSPLLLCPGLPGTVDNYEAEPHLAINPLNPDNLIAAWQQDRSYASRGNVVSFSLDRGATWRTVTVPGADTCQPGQYRLGIADPWLTFDKSGTAYLASLVGGATAGPSGLEVRSSVIVNSSRDGGRTWSEPAEVTPPDLFNDKEMIAADPRRKGLVYAVWDETPDNAPTRTFVSRSTDRATTWSEPVELPARGEDAATHSGHLLVMRDGSLRVFFEQGEREETRRLMMVSSRDRGHTWKGPRLVRKQQNYLPTADGSDPFFAIYEQTVNVSPSGRALYAVFADSTGDDGHSPSSVSFLRSTDGGRHWKRTVVAKLPAFAMLPSIAVGHHRRVGVTWYDFTRDVAGDGKATATYRAAVGTLGKRHGDSSKPRFTRGAFGSFDVNKCGKFSAPGLPGPKLPWMGEYFGLVPQQKRFATAFMGCGHLSKLGPEDVLFAKFR